MNTDQRTRELQQLVIGALNATPQTPSAIARRAKLSTSTVIPVVMTLDKQGAIVGVGNGAWRKYRLR
jgi:DNA-binding IclR family transcriptional regulator